MFLRMNNVSEKSKKTCVYIYQISFYLSENINEISGGEETKFVEKGAFLLIKMVTEFYIVFRN